MISRHLLAWIGAAVLSFPALGCSGEEEAAKPAPAAEILTFRSSADELAVGSSAKLSWTTANATRISLHDGAGTPLELGNARPLAGSVTVSPFADTEYTLVATNRDGKEVSSSLSIRVLPSPEPPAIESFTASASDVPVGTDVTFSWSVRDATQVVLQDARGRVLTTSEEQSGSFTEAVHASTLYRLIATGPAGEATAEAGVVVHGAPIVELRGPTRAILPGAKAELLWSVANASTVTIADAAGGPLYQGTDPTGKLAVEPEITTEYTIVAQGPGGEASGVATVLVTPVIDELTLAGGERIRSGDAVTVSWKIRGASEVRISTAGSLPYVVPEGELEEGSADLRIGPDGAFVLVARSGALEVSRSVGADLSEAPRIGSMHFDPPDVTAGADLSADVDVHWNVDAASRIRLVNVELGEEIDTTAASPRIGFASTRVNGSTTFRLVAENAFGTDERELLLTAYEAPRVLDFTVRPAVVESGETVHLAWTTEHTAQVVVEKDGVPLAVPPGDVNGTFSDQVLIGASYVLKVYNVRGFEIVSVPVEIAIGSPEITRFEVDDARAHVNQELTFEWENVGGQALYVTLDGVDVCTTTSLAEIPAGSCKVDAPATGGSYDYVLRLVSGLGTEVTQTIRVMVTDGPIIDSFTASDELITVGDAITFSWSVDDDVDGNAPTVTLVDSLGASYDVSGLDPSNSTLEVTPAGIGVRTYTLTATTAGTTAATQDLVIDVRGVPSISVFQANPTLVDTQGGTLPSVSTLSWTTEHGATLEVDRLDEDGEVADDDIYTSSTQSTIDSGSTQLTMVAGRNDLLLTIDNGADRTASALVTVDVDPAELLTFTVDETDILAKETVTFSWTTNRATDVWLEAIPAVTVGSTAFEDISGNSTATEITFSNADEGYASFSFPSGFTFPWAGEEQTSATVHANGFLSFGTLAGSSDYRTSALFPVAEGARENVHLAPFWDDLDRDDNGQTSGGKIYWEERTDATGDYLVVMWKNFALESNDQNSPGDLNFEIILRPSGALEYRYGTMSSSGSVAQARADGSEATVGFQITDVGGYNHLFHEALTGGLSNKSISFDFSAPATGSRSLSVRTSQRFRAVARNAHSTSDPRTAEVEVHPPVTINSFSLATTVPVADWPFVLTWNVSNAALVEVLEGTDVLCTATRSGGCEIVESTTGDHVYTLRATGGAPHDVKSATRTVTVRQPLFDDLTLSSTQVAEGSAVTVDWITTGATSVKIDAPYGHSTAAFVDVSSDPGATALTAINGDDTSTSFSFPGTFSFPYDGSTFTSAWVSSNGVVGFGSNQTTAWDNVALPSTAGNDEYIQLAPFWDDLAPGSGGAVYYALRNDGAGDYLVIQWDGFQFSGQSADLNFQVLLYPNGDFEYRYGTMSVTLGNRANGAEATIGRQNLTGTSGMVVSVDAAVTGGLSNRGYLFRASQPLSGSFTAPKTFEICAQGTSYADCRTIAVNVVRSGSVMFSEIMAAPGSALGDPAGEWFEIRNLNSFALDLQGFEVRSGTGETFTLPASAPIVIGPGAAFTFARSGSSGNGGFTPGAVYGSALQLSDSSDTLQLYWGSLLLDEVSWTSNWFTAGESRAVDPMHFGGEDTNDTSDAWCRSAATFGGGSYEGTPNTVGEDDVCESSNDYYYIDSARLAFVDLATISSAEELTNSGGWTMDFYDDYGSYGGIGFDFEFFDETIDAGDTVYVSSEGFITFDTIYGSHYTNFTIPSSSAPNGVIAPFWSDLWPWWPSTPHAYTALVDVGTERARIFQWSDAGHYYADGQLTFQVQLRESGDIVMIVEEATASSPGNQYYFNGGETTVGIESNDNTEGLLYSYNEEKIHPGLTLVFRRK